MAAPPQRPGLVIGVLVALWMTAQVHRLNVAAYLGASSIMADFGLTAAGAGLLAAVYFPAYGVVQVPSGIMADVLRPRVVLLVGGLLFAVSALLFAFAPSFELALAARVAIGLSSGLLWLSCLKLCSGLRGVSYPRAVSLLVSLGSVGSVSALALLPLLLERLSWRAATALISAPILLACLALALVRTPEPERRDDGRPARVRLAAGLRESLGGLGLVLRSRVYWLIFLPSMMWNSGNFALITWLPRYARDVLALPPATVGLLPALLPIGVVIGSWSIGWLLARRPGLGMRPFYLNMVLWTALLAVVASGVAAPAGAAGLYALALGMGLLYGAWFMGLARTGQLAGPRLLGTATGVVNGLGFFPAFAYPWLMGLAMDLVDRPGAADWTYSAAAFRAGFLVVLAGTVAGLVGVLLLQRRPGQQIGEPPVGQRAEQTVAR